MSKAIIFTKTDCPYCTKAKALLKREGIPYKEVPVSSIEQLTGALFLWDIPKQETVPQIIIDHKYVGGYTELESMYRRKTVFNANNQGYKTTKYPLFLGDDPGLTDTINVAYPILDSLFQQQMAQIWNEFEISLTQDRQDMLTAAPDIVEKMVRTISWQHLADSIASRAITGILMEFVSNSELESWYNAVALFESIHSKTYSHIIKQTFVNPNEMLEQTYKDIQVLDRSQTLRDVFDDLANMSKDASKEEKEDKVMLGVVALFLLEAIAFVASFAVTFGIGEMGIFQGITQDVVLIARDELLHARGGLEVLKIYRKENPEAYARVLPKVQELFDAVVEQEVTWAKELFSGEINTLVGLNEKLLIEEVHYLAGPIASSLGVSTGFKVPEKDPLPYMSKYLKSSKVQVAPQELQITAYLFNTIEFTDKVPEKLKEFKAKYDKRNFC